MLFVEFSCVATYQRTYPQSYGRPRQKPLVPPSQRLGSSKNYYKFKVKHYQYLEREIK